MSKGSYNGGSTLIGPKNVSWFSKNRKSRNTNGQAKAENRARHEASVKLIAGKKRKPKESELKYEADRKALIAKIRTEPKPKLSVFVKKDGELKRVR